LHQTCQSNKTLDVHPLPAQLRGFHCHCLAIALPPHQVIMLPHQLMYCFWAYCWVTFSPDLLVLVLLLLDQVAAPFLYLNLQHMKSINVM
jgi:hypothetical protein